VCFTAPSRSRAASGCPSCSNISAPVSTQYFEGRPQDLAYELAGPNVRIRHHIRIWLLDSLSLVWVGAANKDVGVIFKPWEPQATHRIEPHVDWERDRVVHDLDAALWTGRLSEERRCRSVHPQVRRDVADVERVEDLSAREFTH
jgi:hypothetical protein